MSSLTKIAELLYVSSLWSLHRASSLLSRRDRPTHVLFCMVDHFEPGTGDAKFEIEKERMQILLNKYPKLVQNHKDSAGYLPKRTWFFPPHYHRNNNLKELVTLCDAGYGEIELHLHHGKTQPDTSANLEETIVSDRPYGSIP